MPKISDVSINLVEEGQGGGVLSLLPEYEIWSFHILRSSPCPCQCFTCLKVTCCHFIQSLACGEQTLFSALVSPAKKIAEKTSAPRRLSSLMLLFQGHVACRNVYPNRVLIATLSSFVLKGQVGENTRKRLTISSFQPKNVIFAHPVSDQSLTSDSSLFMPHGIWVAFQWTIQLDEWTIQLESEKCEQRVHISSLTLPLTALLFLTIGDLGPICISKKAFY